MVTNYVYVGDRKFLSKPECDLWGFFVVNCASIINYVQLNCPPYIVIPEPTEITQGLL
jgi:hypothetical protein